MAVYTDDFNRTGADLGTAPTAVPYTQQGTWSTATTGGGVASPAGDDEMVGGFDIFTPDCVFDMECDYGVDEGINGGFAIRWDGTTNPFSPPPLININFNFGTDPDTTMFVYWWNGTSIVSGTGLAGWSSTGGIAPNSSQATLTGNISGDTMTVTCSGDDFTVLRNSVQVFAFTTSTYNTQTFFGMAGDFSPFSYHNLSISTGTSLTISSGQLRLRGNALEPPLPPHVDIDSGELQLQGQEFSFPIPGPPDPVPYISPVPLTYHKTSPTPNPIDLPEVPWIVPTDEEPYRKSDF